MKRLLLPVLLAGSVVATAPGQHASAGEEEDLTSQGHSMLGAGGGFSKNAATIGGSFGYFVLDGILPGIRYYYTFQKSSDPDYSIHQHEINLFVRYYLARLDKLYPFAAADTGYLRHAISGDDVDDATYGLYSVFGGGGLLFLLTPHFGIEGIIGVRQYLSVPQALLDGGFSDREVEWNVGFGIYP